MPKGVHSDAYNKWIIAVHSRCNIIMQANIMNERLNILRDLAKGIKGIGEKTIQDTLLEFEKYHH